MLHPLRQRLPGDQRKTIHAAKRHADRKQHQLSERGIAGACYPGNKDKDGCAHTKHCRRAERELGITIFKRTSRGISPIEEGLEAMSYARQIVDQADLMLSRFTGGSESEMRFAVSSQHYEVVVEAFGVLLDAHAERACHLTLSETSTIKVIQDFHDHRSSVGIIYLNDYNRHVAGHSIESNGLEFRLLFIARPHMFFRAGSNLAQKESIRPEELAGVTRFAHLRARKGRPISQRSRLPTFPATAMSRSAKTDFWRASCRSMMATTSQWGSIHLTVASFRCRSRPMRS